MAEDWEAEFATEPTAVLPPFYNMAGLRSPVKEDAINGNQIFGSKGPEATNFGKRCTFGSSTGFGGFGKQGSEATNFGKGCTFGSSTGFGGFGKQGSGDGNGFDPNSSYIFEKQPAIEKASGDGPPVGRSSFTARRGFTNHPGDRSGFSCGRDGFSITSGIRGGYKDRNEDMFLGSERKLRAPWTSTDSEGNNKNPAPKVTYIPPPPPEEESAIFAPYQTGINFAKYDEILVDVSGFNVPSAVMTFAEAQLCETLNNNITKAGYLKPTPVQKYGMPIILAGRDMMACAQTGSGKTAAFLLPILEMLIRGDIASQFKELQEPEVIIVAPTRELINQIYLEARKFSFGTIIRPVVVYGGTSTGYQIRQVLQGCNVLCGTPGRLLDIISKGKVGLSKVQFLVLDEADRMLDMGFEPDMRKLVTAFDMPLKQNRQTLMFSATFPEEIQRLAADFMKTDYLFLAVGQVGGACGDVHQSILQVDQYSKRDKLIEILNSIGIERTMVFVDTKRKADFLAAFLCQEKFPTTSIHGDREQREREQALGDFRSGKCPVLVATAVAARGLDIEHVQNVINFDLPSTIDEYVHRIGRTGRCGNIGKAVSFFDSNTDMRIAHTLVKVLSDAQQEVPAWLEEFGFAASGPGYHNPLGKVFASVDSRKGLGGNKDFGSYEANLPVTYAGKDHEDAWE